MTASKQAFLSPGAVAALRGAAPKAALGAGIGAAGGALLGGEGHRLEGALGGATLGAGVGGAAHFAPQIRETASDLRRMVMPSAETRAALKEVRSQVPSRAPASTAPSLPIRPPAANDVAGAAALDRLDMMLGKAAADGYRDVLETFGLEKNAFFGPALAAAGKALAPVAARAGSAAQRAAPVVSKGLQRAGNVLSHPLTDVGMSGAALWKNAAETPR